MTEMESSPAGGLISAVPFCSLETDKNVYQGVVKKLTLGEIDGLKLQEILTELRRNIGALEKCDQLVSAILYLDWLKHKPQVIDQYKSFIVQLVSVHPHYLRTVLRALIKKFAVDETEESSGKKLHNIHEILLAILKLVPLTSTCLPTLLSECFPYVLQKKQLQVMYVRNVLHITSYLPHKRCEILEIVIDHLIRLDVIISKQKIMELKGRRGNLEQTEEKSMEVEEDAAFNATVETLDSLMELMFTYVNSVCYPEGNLDCEACKNLHEEVFAIFNDRIVKTFCSHTQFILFYICSFKSDLCLKTVDRLWRTVLNPNTATLQRQMSAIYINDLLVRGKFIQLELVTSCLEPMVAWIHRYIDTQNNGSFAFTDFQIHAPFYCVCQAALYIFSTWHRELLNDKEGSKFVRRCNFERIITCSLNPLKVCSPIVVSSFAAVARNYQLAYCYTVIERNERVALSTFGQTVGATSLDIFPFDPYLLETSRRFIEPIYRHFQVHNLEEAFGKNGGEDDDFLRDPIEGTTPPSKNAEFLRSEYLLLRMK